MQWLGNSKWPINEHPFHYEQYGGWIRTAKIVPVCHQRFEFSSVPIHCWLGDWKRNRPVRNFPVIPRRFRFLLPAKQEQPRKEDLWAKAVETAVVSFAVSVVVIFVLSLWYLWCKSDCYALSRWILYWKLVIMFIVAGIWPPRVAESAGIVWRHRSDIVREQHVRSLSFTCVPWM